KFVNDVLAQNVKDVLAQNVNDVMLDRACAPYGFFTRSGNFPANFNQRPLTGCWVCSRFRFYQNITCFKLGKVLIWHCGKK
ncbi:hypothetical protein, partial [Acidaminococcus fermentans]|uniref:hypothetical protein n=1 Tax=Acidaminococcus fermentans TaxID=905 RepID=UPI001C43626D